MPPLRSGGFARGGDSIGNSDIDTGIDKRRVVKAKPW